MIKYLRRLRCGRRGSAMTILVLFCASGAAGTVSAQDMISAQDSKHSEPVAVVEQLQAGLLRLTETHAGASFAEVFKTCEVFVRATHDMLYMAKLALGRSKWQTLSDAEQDEFVALFTQLSITTYVTRFQDMSDIGFTISEQRELSRGRIDVRSSLIRPNGDPVAMSYILHRSDSKFMIINIVAEGVSELALKRAEYQRILDESDFNALAQYLQSRIADMVDA